MFAAELQNKENQEIPVHVETYFEGCHALTFHSRPHRQHQSYHHCAHWLGCYLPLLAHPS